MAYSNGNIDTATMHTALMVDPTCKKEYMGCKYAINAAKLIFKDHLEAETLRTIIKTNSVQTPVPLRLKAIAILDQLTLEENFKKGE